MNVDPLLQIVWQIAEIESRALGAAAIEPMHFLLGTLKIVDPEFPNRLEKLNLTTGEWKLLCEETVKVRHYLDVCPEKVCQIRRRIRHRLARMKNLPIPEGQQIHRSRKSCAAFFDALRQLNGDTITLLQLMHSMFELDFLDVSDMRWRGETQTRTK